MDPVFKHLPPNPGRSGLESVADLYLAVDVDVHQVDRQQLQDTLQDESLSSFAKTIVAALLERSKPVGNEG